MKTTILCFLLVSGLFGLSFSCCPEVPDYWNLTSFQVEIRGYDGTTVPVNDTVNADSLFLIINFGQEFVSDDLHLGPNPFLNTAQATSCSDPGELGMKDELTDIEITSSLDFNSYPAGTSLAPMLFIQSTPLRAWIENKNYNQYYLDTWYITFPTKPLTNKTHDFNIRLTFESGRVEEVQLGALTWN